jgi:hypothetical protein
MTYSETPTTAAESIERLSRATLRVSKAISTDDKTLVDGLYAGLERIADSLGAGNLGKGSVENLSVATVMSGEEVRKGLDRVASSIDGLAEAITAALAVRS